jgi:integral membrane protein
VTAFRRIALLEATSFLALLVATYIKHQDRGEVGVDILGPIHGALFIAYVVLALSLRRRAGWSRRATLLILLGAVAPFGGYVVDAWLARQPAPQAG